MNRKYWYLPIVVVCCVVLSGKFNLFSCQNVSGATRKLLRNNYPAHYKNQSNMPKDIYDGSW